jgi:hypothetical protein
MATEPHDGIDPYDNQETRAAEGGSAAPLARGAGGAGGGGALPSEPVAAGEDQPLAEHAGGTAGGDALAGVTISQDDRADAVSGDTGPENPGERRS